MPCDQHCVACVTLCGMHVKNPILGYFRKTAWRKQAERRDAAAEARAYELGQEMCWNEDGNPYWGSRNAGYWDRSPWAECYEHARRIYPTPPAH
ncbi:hypothetical protein LTR97_008240 [Elasticomyces elasticus]|uniref:Uncharacterized protein n=1 Tax=Elasticomyces elasticus TaxID=574655 RepID=A0AAN7WCC7_9PEZI|nr:hypothetical protein LTR97_008240 [Elasticomyces elasticus]